MKIFSGKFYTLSYTGLVIKESFIIRRYSLKHMRGSVIVNRIKSVGRMLSAQHLGYRLEDRGIVVHFYAGVRNFHFIQTVEISSGTHLGFYSMFSTASIPGRKAIRWYMRLLTPSSAQIKNTCTCTIAPKWCLIKHKEIIPS